MPDMIEKLWVPFVWILLGLAPYVLILWLLARAGPSFPLRLAQALTAWAAFILYFLVILVPLFLVIFVPGLTAYAFYRLVAALVASHEWGYLSLLGAVVSALLLVAAYLALRGIASFFTSARGVLWRVGDAVFRRVRAMLPSRVASPPALTDAHPPTLPRRTGGRIRIPSRGGRR